MKLPKLKETDLAFALLKASRVSQAVILQGRSLDKALANQLEDVYASAARGAISDLAYFSLRWRGSGLFLTQQLTGKKELKPALLEHLLTLAFGLLASPQPAKYKPHTLVDQVVTACAASKDLVRAKGLANACLRRYLREEGDWLQKLQKNDLARWNHPAWWLAKLRDQHPSHFEVILEQANTQPPMVLRINQRCGSAEQYLAKLQATGLGAIVLGRQTLVLEKPIPVFELPGFTEGEVSIQDQAAQLAGQLLPVQDGHRVLDACAAPGGKTGHLLEKADIDLLALDSSEARLERVKSNYERLKPTLGNQARLTIKAAEAQNTKAWWDGQPFDAIVADLPCSGSGVVRRHPDIRWLRRPEDIEQLSQIQDTILHSLWPTLKPGGTLLLVTCSIFLEEGPLLTEAFLKNHPDAVALKAPGSVMPSPVGSGPDSYTRFAQSPDGFYYALFQKALHH